MQGAVGWVTETRLLITYATFSRVLFSPSVQSLNSRALPDK